MPMNTQRVTSIVLFTWWRIEPRPPSLCASPCPQKLKVNLSQLKAMIAIRMKRKMGTSLAMVVMTLTKAACFDALSVTSA